jgi:hypothetical protein
MKNRRLCPLGVLLAGAVAVTACGPGGDDDDDVGECATSLLAGDLVITEIQADLEGDDEGKEWFELHNATGAAVELTGLTLVTSKNDFTGEKTHAMTGGEIPAGGYFVVGGILDELKREWVDYGYADALGALRNTNGLIALRCGAGEIDSVSYDSVPSGASRSLNGAAAPDYQTNDDDANWCPARTVYGPDGELGTPGAVNDACTSATSCNDGGTQRDVVPPEVGDVVITEYMANPGSPPGAANGEWIELAITADVDLNGLQLGQAEPDTEPTPGPKPPSMTLASEDCLRFGAGAYVLLARNPDTLVNGGLPEADFTMSFGLTDSNDGVFVGHADQPLDVVTWTTGRPSGRAVSLDKDNIDPATNDDDRFWCNAVDEYGTAGLFGTPAAENPNCDIAPPDGMCLIEGGGMRNIVVPAPGQLRINEWMAAPLTTDGTSEWLELEALADFDLNGLQLGQAEPDTEPTPGPKPVAQTLGGSLCLPVISGDYVLMVRSDDPAVNGGIAAADVDFLLGFGLTNTNDGVFIGIDDTVLDMHTWASSPAGASVQIDPATPTMTCSPPTDGSQMYGAGGHGTPGALNVCM